jgi:hypothetical protein
MNDEHTCRDVVAGLGAICQCARKIRETPYQKISASVFSMVIDD